ncbi:hypothetical protein JBL43_09300 [Aureibaculum sp. A20]|uniref:Lipoprotein n=1 Tax=Aureibaculum flavum TaxID=2795986 RepID=A0ABS0WR31_9FLAO|nr:hypothetical protein [Aureibaculum flavum]MBJ2174432.1 hypothetical protein [Aureibaculum flavum]
MRFLIILIILFSISSCQQSELTKTANMACECIEKSVNKDRQEMNDCINESIGKNGDALKEYVNEDQFEILDTNGNISNFYYQLVFMTMLSDECSNLVQGK